MARPDDTDEFRPVEFWQEEERSARVELRRQLLRWLLVFGALAAAVVFTLWWAGSIVRFSAARAEGRAEATWRIYGVVTDGSTGEPVPFARIADDPHGQPPVFHALADHLGHYELQTVAEKHAVLVTALGFRPARIQVGRAWYAWMPAGEERLDVRLERE